VVALSLRSRRPRSLDVPAAGVVGIGRPLEYGLELTL